MDVHTKGVRAGGERLGRSWNIPRLQKLSKRNEVHDTFSVTDRSRTFGTPYTVGSTKPLPGKNVIGGNGFRFFVPTKSSTPATETLDTKLLPLLLLGYVFTDCKIPLLSFIKFTKGTRRKT